MKNKIVPNLPCEKPPFIRSVFFAILLSLAFFLLHLFRLGYHGFWIDELHTYGSISSSWPKLFTERLSAGHIPTYFILMKVWCGLTEYSEWWMRIPSVVFATLAFLAFFLLVRDFLADNRIFAAAVALFFFHPFLLWASHDARMYSAVILASTLAAHQLLSYAATGRTRFLAGYACAALFGLSLHLLFFFQVLSHAVFIAVHHRHLLKRYAIAAAMPLALLLPVTLLTISRAKEYSPGMRLRWPDVFLVFRKMSAIGSTDFARFLRFEESWVERIGRNLGGAFFLVFLLLGVAHLRAQARKAPPPAGQAPLLVSGSAAGLDHALLLLRYCFYWIGVHGLMMAISQVFNNDKVGMTRYYSPLLGAAAVLVAFELGARDGTRWRRLFRWAYLAFFVFTIGVQLNWKGPGIREAFEILRQEAGPNDGVVFSHTGALRYAFAFYGCENMDRLPASRKEKDKEFLLEDIQSFAEGKDRVWLLLHNVKSSFLPDLLNDHPKEFEIFENREILGTYLKGYKVKDVDGVGTSSRPSRPPPARTQEAVTTAKDRQEEESDTEP